MASNTRGSKRQRTTADTDAYELLYWPGIPGRGEHVRLVFEATGTAYTDVCNASPDGIKQLVPLIQASAKDDEHNPPPFAPPVLRHGTLRLSQTPSILAYLAPRLGLVPAPEADPDGTHHVQGLALTALDGLSNEPHDTHHPVAAMVYYEDQKPEALKKAKDFRENRLPKFLGYFERVLDAPSSGGGEWLYGGGMTYADLVFFQGLDGTTFAFPKRLKTLRDGGKYGKVFELYERVKALPKVKAYLESDRRQAYSKGIYRHYPELDGE